MTRSAAKSTKPLFTTIGADVTELATPRFVPKMALLLHGLNGHEINRSAREIVASIHKVERHKGGWHLGPGRLIDRTEELTLAQDLIDAEPESRRFDLFPQNLLHTDSHSATWYLPPVVRRMAFRTKSVLEEVTVPWPALVCHARGPTLFLAAIGVPEYPAASTPLCHAPLGNVYDDTKLCLGKNPPPRGESVHNIPEWTRILYDSPFTAANHPQAYRASRSSISLRSFWWSLQRKESFPSACLTPLKHTLGSWVNHIANIGEDFRDDAH